MAYKERKEIIEKIEKIRGTKVITYVISTRQNIRTMIEVPDLRQFFDHLKHNDINGKKIDLFIYSNGGDSTVGWSLPNLIREYTEDFSVIIPFRAFSCATSISLGANRVIMTKMGTLGPIDPTVMNEFNPIINGQRAGISVEDVNGYISLVKEKFGIRRQKELAQLFDKLPADVKPLALGNVYRHYQKSRDDARKLLSLHLDHKKDKKKIDKIISTLVEKLYFHGHHINREEAKNIGFDIVKSEDISSDFNDLVWDLYLDYEKEMKLCIPYQDSLEDAQTSKEIPVKYIESTVKSSVFKIKQNWVDMGLQEGSKLILANNGQPAVFLPNGQALAIIPMGMLVMINNKIYDKQETTSWE
jgi:hypothetical protein